MNYYMVEFDYEHDKYKMYKKMSEVLIKSIIKHDPTANIKIDYIEAPKIKILRKAYVYTNTEKLKYWVDYINNIEDNTVLLDVDMVLNKPINDVFNKDFDVAITTRENDTFYRNNTKAPINGGVIFVKPTEGARQYFKDFYEINDKMLNDFQLLHQWQEECVGMNQAAMQYLRKNPSDKYNILELPTLYYNLCPPEYKSFDPDKTSFIHLKSHLREQIFRFYKKRGEYKIKKNKIPDRYKNEAVLFNVWKGYHDAEEV